MTNEQEQHELNRSFLTTLKGMGEVQRAHQGLIEGLFRIFGYYNEILNAQLKDGEANLTDATGTVKAREALQAANSEVTELRRIYELEAAPKPEQPN